MHKDTKMSKPFTLEILKRLPRAAAGATLLERIAPADSGESLRVVMFGLGDN